MIEYWLSEQFSVSVAEKIKLRAVYDFDPKQMSHREGIALNYCLRNKGMIIESEYIELSNTLQGRILMEYFDVWKKIGYEKCIILHTNEGYQHEREKVEMRRHDATEYEAKVYDCEGDEKLHELSLPIQKKQINPENEVTTLENKDYSIIVKTSDIQIQEEAIKMEELTTVMGERELDTHQEDLNDTSSQLEGEDSLILTFNRGDKMETILREHIG